MGKYAKYTKHYRKEWEKEKDFKGWLCRAPEALILAGKGEAYCKICQSTVRAHKTDLQKHLLTKAHQSKATALDTKIQKSLTVCGVQTSNTKMTEIKLCMHMAAHNSIKNIDHLSELLKECGKGSDLEKLRLHRTKTSKIILKVISPAMFKEMIEDIGNEPFSIILEESTDVSDIKYMAYCIRYFSKRLNTFVVDFLGFSEIFEATAEKLYEHFMEFMSETGLNYKNMIGIGTDGANNLCGKSHSLYTLLKEKIPHLQLIKCVCHSLNLCASNASDELPCRVEFLLRETRTWFSHSPLRQMRYSKMYQLINAGKQPPKLIQLSSTRWLAWSEAVSTNIKQWLELKQHFQLASKTQDDKCYTARTLANMYEDDSNLLCLLFLDGILKDVTNLNLAFQKTNADITKLYADLHMLLMLLVRRIIKPYLKHQRTSSILHQANIDDVARALEKVHQDFENVLLPLESLSKKDVWPTIRLCNELVKRLPYNLPTVESLRYLTPEMCLNQLNTSYRNLPWELAGIGLNYKNMIDIGTDGASNLCGKNHSLYTLLKEKIPHLQLIKCVCHSLNLCASNASDELPCTVEFLLRETRKWFSHSPLRQMKYSKMYQLINAGKQPPKLIQLSSTRWLAWSEAVSTNIKQWLELKHNTFNWRQKPKTINAIQQERLQICTKTTRTSSILHQADIDDVVRVLEKVHQDFENALLPLESVNFGHRFESYAAKKTISQTSLKVIQERCVAYTIRLCNELVKRLPYNLPTVESLRYLTPEMCLNQLNTSYRNLPWELA
ncbi:PREDICTED: uncharacterized protein LOC105457853, partial [Wasmannia auropunctata]|uniref:uncharacterized protein LOC105457853 n=1 Tax=Wasmannia auropunctata TaxID=64793 RepID=UPI0005EE5841